MTIYTLKISINKHKLANIFHIFNENKKINLNAYFISDKCIKNIC